MSLQHLRKFVTVSFLALFALFSSVVYAQSGNLLTYGQAVTNSIGANNPLAFYTFNGTEGDLVTIRVISLSPDFDTTVTLNAPAQSQLAFNDGDPLSPNSRDARVDYRLTSSGVYTILVGGTGAGDFVLLLDGRPAEQAEELTGGGITADVTGTSLLYRFSALAEQPAALTISSETPDFAFVAIVRDSTGQAVAILSGSTGRTATFFVPPGEETYEIEISSSSVGRLAIDYAVLAGGAAPVPRATEQVAPEATAEATAEVTPEVVATEEVQPTEEVTQEVAPEAPTLTPTLAPDQEAPVVTATYTPTDVPLTATYTPTYTPTDVPPTATYTPTDPPPVAPPDANFNDPLNIPLDSTASVTDFVSHPTGDTVDRVRWDITGMNPNTVLSGGRAQLTISISCFGTGTDHVQFFTGGQTYSCGQTIVDREVTYDSRTGQVTITAVAGESTYVQWVVTGTATRIN